jgi:predicted Fe-Mo cluster-binding NifX family protein
MDKELIVVKGKVIEQQRSYSPEIGKDISYERGAKMIKRHFDENPDDVVAHFLGRNQIEQILAQPGCIGIRMFQALNEMGIKQMVLVGVNKDGSNILNIEEINQQGQLTTKAGKIVSEGKPCPPYCGGVGPSTDSGSTSWW